MSVIVRIPWGQRTAVIPGNTIKAADIETDAVETAKIKNSAVIATKLAAGAVTTTKILDANVTAAKIATGALNFSGFSGSDGAGDCTLTGAKEGDIVLGVVSITDGGSAAASFESTITVADQIQQSSESDLSTKDFSVLLLKTGS